MSAVAASPNVIAATESGTLFTNEGATAENCHTLPSAVAGLQVEFYCQDADGIKITAATGDTIRTSTGVSAAAGYIQTLTQYSWIRLRAINATEWVQMCEGGTWTIDS